MTVRNILRREDWGINRTNLLLVPQPTLTVDEVSCPNGHDDVYSYETHLSTVKIGCEQCDELLIVNPIRGEIVDDDR